MDRAGRPSTAEIDHLARLWHEGWHDAHASLAPPGLVRARTLDSFRERMAAALADTFVIGPPGAPSGFFMLKDDELYQFYVAREARGSGIAAALIADAEARLAGARCCDRLARLRDRQRPRGAVLREVRVGEGADAVNRLETPDGVFEFEVWRYEKKCGDLCHGRSRNGRATDGLAASAPFACGFRLGYGVHQGDRCNRSCSIRRRSGREQIAEASSALAARQPRRYRIVSRSAANSDALAKTFGARRRYVVLAA